MEKTFYERAGAMALLKVFGFEPKTVNGICGYLGSLSELFRLPDSELESLSGPDRGKRNRLSRAVLDESLGELEMLNGKGIQFITRNEKAYPGLLLDCPDAPVGLYVKSISPAEEIFNGHIRCISVVGTRDPTLYGIRWCTSIVEHISRSPERTGIVSGLALGIDIKAHLAALESGIPTIAVLPT